MKVPTFAQLQALQGQPMRLTGTDGVPHAALLARVEHGVAMDEHHACYSAELLLEPDTQLPQAVYTVHAGAQAWPLLLTPVGLGAERRGRLQAVVHRPVDEAEASHR